MFYIFGTKKYSQLVFYQCSSLHIDISGFTADDDYVSASEILLQLPVLKSSELAPESSILNGTVFENQKGPDFLKDIFEKHSQLGLKFPGFSTLSHETIELKTGSQIWDQVFIDCFSTIGEMTQVRPGCQIGHDVTIGSFCYLAPGTKVGSYSEISDEVFVGFNACIHPKSFIGKNVVIAANAYVKGDVPSNTLVLRDGTLKPSDNPFKYI